MVDIEIFSDVICPWCFIGKRRLDTVLAGPLGEGVSLRWRPYMLYPNIAPQGIDRLEMLKRRYGEQAELGRLPERISEEAASEGITLRYDLIQRTPNTLAAHRLLEYAYEFEVQHELAEILFQAYFCQGLDVGSLDVLADLAAAAGLERAAVEEFLHSDALLDSVQQQLARAPELGISGVPGYYLANAFLLPGAQTSEVMAQILARVKDRLAS